MVRRVYLEEVHCLADHKLAECILAGHSLAARSLSECCRAETGHSSHHRPAGADSLGLQSAALAWKQVKL